MTGPLVRAAIKVKYLVYTSGAMNNLLWGCKMWNLTKKTLNKLISFHHSAIRIRCILHIRWHQVREKHIKNSEVLAMFFNIPNVDASNMLLKLQEQMTLLFQKNS
jgi:hypothetical protein